jgi:8-oxo-dGTP pyrophosphatase MutT (NUDIX family)
MAERARRTSCGIVVTDGERILLGHATRSPRWDIPKGEGVPGESFAEAASRELREETGLAVDPSELVPLGVHPYLRHKDLALFAWRMERLPQPDRLSCRSSFVTAKGEVLPEFDRFGLLPWEEAIARVGKNLAQRLLDVARAASSSASG